jgi:hypothetical protein
MEGEVEALTTALFEEANKVRSVLSSPTKMLTPRRW